MSTDTKNTDPESKYNKTDILRTKYMSDYYRQNKERILSQRKRRYQSDHTYRKHLNEKRRRDRLIKSQPDVYQNLEVDNTPPELTENQKLEFTTKMRVIHPSDPSRSCVCTMHTIKSLAFAINIDKKKLDVWLYKEKLPKARYRNSKNWRIYTEYEVEIFRLAFKKFKKKAKLNNYVFRLTKELQEYILDKFKKLEGGIPPEKYETTDDQ